MNETKTKSKPRRSREMLDKWAANRHARHIITEFWEWLEGEKTPEVMLRDADLERALDEYHGIDQRQLEKERRLILEEYQPQPEG